MKIVDARAIVVGAVDPRDTRDFSRYLALEATNFNIFSYIFFYMINSNNIRYIKYPMERSVGYKMAAIELVHC